MKRLHSSFCAMLVTLAFGCGGTLGEYDDDAGADPTPDPVPEPTVDMTPDPTPDPVPDPIPDPIPDPGTDPAPSGGCADGSEEDTFGANMAGCAGSVWWPNRDDLCASGWSACTAGEWVTRRGGATPGHIYWTDDDLSWSGEGPGDCAANTSGGYSCGYNTPMRVCSDNHDAESNVCNWTHCGLDSTTPDEWFGGCQDNPTAGTLCCR